MGKKDAKKKETRIGEREEAIIDGTVDGVKHVKAAVDNVLFGAVKGAIKGGVIGVKGGAAAVKEILNGPVEGVKDGASAMKDSDTGNIQNASKIVGHTSKGMVIGTVKGSKTLVKTAVEVSTSILEETGKGVKNTIDGLTDSTEKVTDKKIRKEKEDA